MAILKLCKKKNFVKKGIKKFTNKQNKNVQFHMYYIRISGPKYSRIDQVKFVEDSL